jgi:hypothetical protein
VVLSTAYASSPRRKNVGQAYSVVDVVDVSVTQERGAVSVTVPLLMVSVWVVVSVCVISDGVVIVVVSEVVVDSIKVLVTVPRERMEEQYTLPSSS